MQGANLGGNIIKIDFGNASTSTNTNNSNNNTPTMPSRPSTSDDNQPRKSLYLSLPHEVNPTEKELYDEFSKYSRVESVKCAPEMHYAFVNFECEEGARLALDIYHSTVNCLFIY